MEYKLNLNIPTGINIKRIIRELDKKIIGEIKYSKKSKQEIIHSIRKRCKEIRGILRLLRPKYEYIYKNENSWYRDTARDISFIRDLQSIIDVTDKLFQHSKNQLKKESYLFIYKYLNTRRDAVYNDKKKLNEFLTPFLKKTETAHGRVNFWPIKDNGFKTINKGLQKTYKRGRKAMSIAYKKPNTENFHEWRKRVKYHWFHLRLLSSVWPDFLRTYISELEQLSEILGDEHDLANLEKSISAVAWEENKIPLIRNFFEVINKRRKELRKRAHLLGKKLFFEKPEYLSERFGHYWAIKRKELTNSL